MYKLRWNYKRLSLCIILALQFGLVLCYFLLQVEEPSNHTKEMKPKVSFLNAPATPQKHTSSYYTPTQKFVLKMKDTNEYYIDFNASLCFKGGTDLKSMQHARAPQWKCDCLVGWHGNDCSQPEVIWRALLGYRKPLSLKGRKYQRHVIAIFEVTEFSTTMAEIRVNELNSSVDLFVLYENTTTNYLEHKLNSNFLVNHHNKIMYLKVFSVAQLWNMIKQSIVLKDDDIVFFMGQNEVPNTLALQFFKLYDKWPRSVQFRYRWSVYGFFWMHPSKTVVKGGMSMVSNLYDAIRDQKVSKPKGLLSMNFIIGDLNHFGGWYCEFCFDPPQIVDYLNTKEVYSSALDLQKEIKIDTAYIEDLIENGLYLDGSTALGRTHRFQERYFAPDYVTNYSWKYDSLLINLYSKLDY